MAANRGGRKGVLGSGMDEEKDVACEGLIHVARFTVTAFPIEAEVACTRPGKRI